MSHILISICLVACIRVCKSIDFFWKIAQFRESHAETCLRNNLYPLDSSNIQLWNEPTMKNVVTNILGLSILNNTGNQYGIAGCCAPGLWCVNSTCFTQSFGSNFVNYGWLGSISDAHPVYTCHNDSKIVKSSGISSISRSGSQIHMHGTGLGSENSNTKVSVFGSSCLKTQHCNCETCTSSTTCSLDSRCYITDKKHSTGYCFQSCGGSIDSSCPCNYGCRSVFASDGSAVSLCIPPDLNSFYEGCVNKGGDQLLCNANSTIYGSNYVSLVNATVGVTSETDGTASNIHGSIALKCSTNSNCFDGNLCTQDECIEGHCVYTVSAQCDSILLEIKQSYTPYGYNSLFFSNETSQTEFYSQMLASAQQWKVNWQNKAEFIHLDIPFWFLYFGNLVNKMYVTATGSISFPPFDPSSCTAQECVLFTSYANTISPWYSKLWSQGQVFLYVQRKNVQPYIRNINSNAVHIMFQNMIKSDGEANSTFSVSIYEDGSIRHSYFHGAENYAAGSFKSDFCGLWGAYASRSKSFFRYHSQNSSSSMAPKKHDSVYCPYNSTACVVESCVSAGQYLYIRWNGTESCSALTGDNAFVTEVICNWHGGISQTYGSFVQGSSITNSSKVLACLVPTIQFSDGALIPVEVIMRVKNQQTGDSVEFFSSQDSKTIYSITEGHSNELSRSNILVRYYSKETPVKCGCSPLPSYGNKECSRQGVCADASKNTNAVNDCAQTPFGSAFLDSCQTCSGGYSKNIPNFSCDGSSGNGIYDLLTQTIILLMVICCLTFITSTVSFSIRRMLMHRNANADVLAEHMLADLLEMANAANANQTGSRARGLSEFECDAIGVITFTNEFYNNHKKNLETREKGGGTEPHGVIDFNESEKGLPDSCECSICLMDIQEGNICRVLPDPCGHIFHQSCIDEWFKQSAACPLCKRSMKTLLGLDEEIATNNTDRPQFMYRPFTIRVRGPLAADGNERATIRWVFNLDPPIPPRDGNMQTNDENVRVHPTSRNMSHPYQPVNDGSGIILDEDPEANAGITEQSRDNS